MFENTTTVTTENAVGTPTFTNSIEASTFSTGTPCQGSRMLIQDNWGSNDYLQFTVNTTGYGNMSMSFCNRTDNTSIGTFLVQVSSDLGATWTTVLSSFTPTVSNNTLTTGTFPASANNQPEVRIQILKISNPNNLRDYFLDNVTLTGTAGAYPTVSAVPAAAVCPGTAFNITGTNFTGTTAVQVNNANVASFVVNSATSITATLAAGNTSGVVKVTNAVGSGSSVASVTIHPAPTSVTATPSATTVCLGGTINLTSSATSNSDLNVTLINENFNTANSWTKTNTSTGGTPANAAWTQRADGYSYTDTNNAANVWHSNDNSQFYLTNSDAQGNGATTATTLAVPTFSTVGLASASLSYYQHYRTYAGQTALVEISNNGSTWTTLVATPGATVGSITGFVQNTVAIPAGNLGQANVYIRFRFNSPFGWWWAIDNLNVSGVYSAPPAPTYAWTSVPAGFTSSLQNPTNVAPTVNTVYTVTATNSYGCTASASTVSVTVNPVSVGGTVTTSTTVCSGTNSGTLFLNGQTGNVIRWESSLDNFATAGTPITNTTTSLIYSNLTATTSFRAVVQSGVCASANSVAATVTVNPVSVGGTVGNSVTVCSGSNSGSLLVSGHVGNVIRWESSLDGFATAGTPIAVTNTSLNYSNLTTTTSYRAVIQSGVCTAANSDFATITVNPATVAGTVTGAATVCSGSNSGTLNLGTHTGNVIRWESSLDNFATAGTPIANTTASLLYSNLTATTSFRAVVQSGVCASANSEAATITVNPVAVGGTVNTSTSVCTGTNSGTLNLVGNVGNVIGWESSLDGFATAGTPIANTTTSLNYSNLTATTSYRAVVQSGVCGSANSAFATITVNPVSVGGTVGSNATVCTGSNSGTLNLSGNTGNVIRWESSLDGFATAGIPIANTTTSLTYNNITSTTSYRAVVQSGVCASANSGFATVTVNAASVGGTVSGSTTVCANTNSGSLVLSGYAGTITKWQSSDLSDFSAGVLDIPNTTANLSYVNLSATTYYRAVVTNGVCALAYSSVAAITVENAAVGGTVSGNATVCYANGSGTLTLSGNSGAILGWESSLNNFVTAGVPIANTTATQNYTNLTNTTYYRAVIDGGSCGNSYSSVGVVTVDNNTIWIGTNGSAWNDAANWSCGAVPTSDVNVTITSVMNEPVISADAFAKTLTMDPGTTLTIQSGNDLRVVDAVIGLGNALLTIENNANLIQELDVANAGNAVVKRTSNALMRLDYTLWSSPVTGTQTLLNFSPATTANRFYIYNPSTDLYNTVTPSATTFSEGTGYLIRMPNNHPTTPTLWNGQFSGTLNNGDVNVAVTSGTYNAIGNPYPSTIDADMFITENNITEALYFWRKTNNDLTTSYATYTLAGGVGTSANTGGDPNGLVPNGIIQVGQGFIAKSTSANFNFNNGMRLGNNANQFFRTSEVERNRIWLNLTNTDGVFSQTMVSYMTGATYGIDAAIDGPYFNDSQLALTSIINNNEYAVQGRSLPFDNTDAVALGFKAIAAGNYTIGIDHADGLFADVSQDVYLKDNLDNSIHDLRAGNYSFASEAGVFNGRFEIVYLNSTLSVSNPVWDASQVVVYKQGNDLVVNSGKQTMASVKVFDIRGRLLAEQENINASETKLFVGTTNQVLIVKIVSTDHKEVVKKVMN